MLSVTNISKAFGTVQALDDVSIDFTPGELHAIVGENGAGKSTLIKIICGIYQPDSGSVTLEGKPLALNSYHDALAHKIVLVNQEIQVIPKSTIAENIMLDKIERHARNGAIRWAAVNQEAQRYMDMVGLSLPFGQRAGELSAAQKQLVMIARALSGDAKVLILDEPTSSLTQHEANNLFDILGQLQTRGVTIIFVSHKLEEVLRIGRKVTVLRDGRCVGTRDVAGLSKQDIVSMMIGRAAHTQYLGSLNIDKQQKVLEVRNLSQLGRFENINLSLYKGEILGFYGLVGSGRTELAQILIGEARKDSGQILINGQEAHIKSVADCLYKYKMGYVTENRKEKGLILGASIKTNIAITVWKHIVNRIGAISLRQESTVSQKFMQATSVRATGQDQLVSKLSGGNQQKVSISKWLAAGCDILIIDEPTVGVDIGAKEYIHQLIWELACNQGKSIILISSDMPEMINLARRILVFRNFKIVGEVADLNESEHSYDEVSQAIATYLA